MVRERRKGGGGGRNWNQKNKNWQKTLDKIWTPLRPNVRNITKNWLISEKSSSWSCLIQTKRSTVNRRACKKKVIAWYQNEDNEESLYMHKIFKPKLKNEIDYLIF